MVKLFVVEMKSIKLTEIELAAKEHFMLLFREGLTTPCDIEASNLVAKLPPWYDEVKYKRGQKYFFDNRLGILNSNLVGLLCLLAEPKGLRILASTGKSSTPETARKRYVSTILHTISWYEIDLSPNSKSWESLNKVRKLHFMASKSAKSNGLGFISQAELAFTTFGFMGFALIRPHVLSIKCDNREDREAFVHLWAVLCYMIGVKDRFNICLLKFEVLEVFCHLLLRYFFLPLIQIETPQFKEMVNALLKGLAQFMPYMTYDIQMYFTKRVVCVPGYQFDVDKKKEILCRDLLTAEDLDECQKYLLQVEGYDHAKHFPVITGVPLFEIDATKKSTVIETNSIVNDSKSPVYCDISADQRKYLHDFMGLTEDQFLNIRNIEYNTEWVVALNDSKFYELTPKQQKIIRFHCSTSKFYEYRIGKYLVESLFSICLFLMRKYQARKT